MVGIKEKLFELSDKQYKEFNSKLCPDTSREMLGVRVPQVRKLAKELLKEYSLDTLLSEFTNQYFEEVLLEGLIIAYAKILFEDKLLYIEKFVPKIDSWAISDTFVPTLKLKTEDLEIAWKFILPYTQSEEQFEVRFSVIMMLYYFITDEHVDKVLKEIDEINHEGYYVKMGIAWLVAEIGVKFYDKAISYLQHNHLDDFTHNKAIQKMRESYRITPTQKEYLNTLKRR
jgi:3-methyladenine DNA glycosylase AlkD